MHFTKALCVATFCATIHFGSMVASHLQGAEAPLECPLDGDNAFLGKPVYDVQKTGVPEEVTADVDGKKVRIWPTTSFQVAQDGSILVFWDESEKGLIYVKRSEDGGETWEGEHEDKYLPDGPPDVYGCKAGLVRLPIENRDVLIYSSPQDMTTKHRMPITARASFDGGKTWPLARTLPDGEIAGYTWLGTGRAGTPSDGMIYLLSQTRHLARFNLAWMLEKNEFVAPTYKPGDQTNSKPREKQVDLNGR